MPRHIARFERLIYASLVIGVVVGIADFARLSKAGSAVAVIGVNVASVAVLAWLTWLIARRRRNWARWLLLALYLLGLPFLVIGLLVTEVGGVEVGRPSLFILSLIALQAIAQAAALVLVFTGDASAWFAPPARPARLLEIEMPRSVARFEIAAYAGLILGAVATAFAWVVGLQGAGARIGAAAAEVVGAGVAGLLIWLVARRRKNWARWLFVIVCMAGLANVALAKLGQAGRPIDALHALQAVLWAVALFFVFAADAHAWFKPVPGAPRVRSVWPKPRFRVPAGRREVVAPGEMGHTDTVDAYIAEMAELGVGTYTSAPPVFRLLWALGAQIPPPLFLGVLPLTVIAGSLFAVFWGLGMWLTMWRSAIGLPAWLVLAVTALAGLLFGLCLAAYYRWKARSLALPSWENYLPPRK